jgi:hypothetical protein
MLASGWRTKLRFFSWGWGIASRRERNLPPLHRTMSRSSTRGPQRLPARRPNARSIALSRPNISRLEPAFDQRHRVGEIAACAAFCPVDDDRRGVEQPEFLIELGDRRFEDAGRAPMPPVWPVRSDRDRVKVVRFFQAQMSSVSRP